MRYQISLAVLTLALPAVAAFRVSTDLPRIRTHDNERTAGTLKGNVLHIRLEARLGTWRPHGDEGPAVEMLAFGETGKQLQIPGPLIRVTAGTEVVVSLRNALADSALTCPHLDSRPLALRKAPEPFKVAPGETREVKLRLDAPAAYHYWATTMGRELRFRTLEDAQ